MKTALLPSLALCCVIVSAATQGGAAPPAPKVPGEKWRQSFSMQMQGMRMPQQTLEYCVPVGKAQERALMPPDDKQKCEVYDVRTSGNRTTAKMRCNGPEPMTAEMDVTSEPDHIFGTNRMKSAEGEMVMTFDSRKLGSCMADDPKTLEQNARVQREEALRGPREEQLQACRDNARGLVGKPGDAAAVSTVILGTPACRGTDSFKTYCNVVQTHEGFRSLDYAERPVADQPLDPEFANNPMALANLRPLTASVEACGLGKDKAAVTALKTRLLGSAEAANAWPFLADYGDDAMWTKLRGLVRQHCSGRAFTTATDARYQGLCQQYGEVLSRNERRPAEGQANPLNAAMAPTTTTPSGTPAAEPATGQPEQAGGKQAAKEAVETGKKILRGLFGR